MTRDDIIRMAREAHMHHMAWDDDYIEGTERFAALIAAAEQRPISDVTEAVTKTVIEVEKLLCVKLGRQWQPAGMSIQTLVDELAALVAAAEREACAKACEWEAAKLEQWPQRDVLTVRACAAAIRARGEQEEPR